MKRLIFAFLRGIKYLVKGIFQNIFLFIKLLRSLVRMMFQNMLAFLKNSRTYVIEMYHAIADLLVNFFVEFVQLAAALALLLSLYIPGIAGLLAGLYVYPSRFLSWFSWGYIGAITLIGIFYRPEGVSLLGQADVNLSRFFSPGLLSDDHYFKYIKELMQQWKELQQSVKTEKNSPIATHLKSITAQYKQVLTSCNEYCKQGMKIRKYLNRKNPERLSEEIRKRQLEATSAKNEKVRKNYRSVVSGLKDELQQITFYKQKLEHLDSYLIKVVSTIRNIHSKVLQVGVSDELKDLGETFFYDLEIEAQALSEVLSRADKNGFAGKKAKRLQVRPQKSHV